MSPPTPTAFIPSITDLRNALDYGNPKLPRCAAFTDDMRVFRKKFRTKNGVCGVDLHDWKSQEGQSDLTEMTIAYLDTEGNGSVFWPDDPASPNLNKYRYSNTRDRQEIQRIVKELFYKLNIQQHRNQKYKQKMNSNVKKSDDRGRSAETATDVDSIVFNPTPRPPERRAPTADMSLVDDVFDQFINDVGDNPAQIGLDNTEVYDGPRSKSPQTSRMRQFEPTESAKGKRPLPSDTTSKEQPSKRRKRQPKASLLETQPAAASSSGGQSWKSPRNRKKTQREGFCDLEELTEVFSPAQTPIREPTPDQKVLPSIERTPTIGPGPLVTHGDMETRGTADSGPQHATATTEEEKPSSPSGSKPDETRETPLSQLTTTPSLPPQSLQPSPEPKATPPAMTTGPFRPQIDFVYRVVQTRIPSIVSKSWTPRGRFQDKTLAQLVEELPFEEVPSQGVIFTIESECMTMVEHVAYNDEKAFDAMKKLITIEIRGWVTRQIKEGRAERLNVFVLIEKAGKGGGKDEGLEVEFGW